MIYLASSSPRRQDILKMLNIDFEVIKNKYDESKISEKISPKEFVLLASKNKALSVLSDIESGYILSADTIGFYNDKILLKPKDKQDAISTLKSLRNKTHIVYTGITLIKKNNIKYDIYTAVEQSKVTFGDYPDKLIDKYVIANNSEDKAASYGIQDEGAFFVKKINGCFFNVMGLPVNKLLKLLLRSKYNLV